METNNITILPNVDYGNLRNQKIETFAQGYCVNYGYIKKRDIQKWENNENVSVKMGMLSPFGKCYRGLNIIKAAEKRISEQDTTALFEEDDELIPVYVFAQKETDKQWREYLTKKGYKSARANREGIVISKEKLFGEYELHYQIDTQEAKTLKEEEKIAEEARKKQIERDKKRWAQQVARENKKKQTELKINYEKRNPGRNYEKDKKEQEELFQQLKSKQNFRTYHIDENFIITEQWREQKLTK